MYGCGGVGGGGVHGCLIGNCSSHQLFWKQRYKRPPPLNTIQSVAPYCAAQMKDGQWKAGLQWDSIWLICNERNQTTDANRGRSALSIKGRWAKCLVITKKAKVFFTFFLSLSPVNHGGTGSVWWRSTCTHSEGPNAVILAGLPSPSVHPNPVNSLWPSQSRPFKSV